MSTSSTTFVRAASLSEVQSAGCMPMHLNGHTLALYAQGDGVFAIDNRCPHMGFPMDKGSLSNGILTCHWHHARFDLESGGTFDQWADDLRVFPVEIRDDEVWVDLGQHRDPRQHQQERLRIGLERDISLVMGKAIMVLLDNGGDPVDPFRTGLDFGTKYRSNGWGQGLTMLTCFMNMLPQLAAEDRPRALYHGLSAVARESFGAPPRFPIPPLPSATSDIPTLKRWFRQFIEVRDNEGAERCIVSAIRAGADDKQMADILFSAATDRRYIQIGHVADFTNKAFEALDIVGWDAAEQVLTSLVSGYAEASRMEESNSWRHPIDLVAILETAFSQLPAVVEAGQKRSTAWQGRDACIATLQGDDPQDIANVLLTALKDGCTLVDLAQTVSYTAALRIARFHTSNEFGDWDTALHTFTFANAIEQGLRRAPSIELLRGVFDAAMSIYQDRFLNIPPARLPQPNGRNKDAALESLPALLDRQQQVNQAGDIVGQHLYHNGNAAQLLAMIGRLLLREDRDFHTIQTVEAAFKQHQLWGDSPAAVHVLIAAVRYLAAHSPTVRAQGQTYEIAYRLHRGEKVYEG